MTEAEKRLVELLNSVSCLVREIKDLSVSHSKELAASNYEAILYLSGANWDNPHSIVCEAAQWLDREVSNGDNSDKAT